MVLAKWDPAARGSNGGNLIPVFSLNQYLTQENQLSIPPWQREYTWDSTSDDGEIGQLMIDLKQFVESDSGEYLIGAVILCDTADPKVKYIIDGQQRTVTLTLFLMAAFKYLTREIRDKSDHNLLTEIEKCFNRGSHFDPQPSVVFAQKKADNVMQQIRAWLLIEGEEADKNLREQPALSQTQKNLLAVMRYFSKGLTAETWFSRDQIKGVLWRILRDVKVLQLNLDNQREAIRVYDRINNRGRHLSGGDLVKNLMFEKVNDDRFEDINESWTAVVETLRHLNSAKMQEPTFLLRSLAWGFRQGKTTYDELPDFFIRHFESGGPGGTPVDPLDFAEGLVDSAEALSHFAALKHRKHGNLPLLMVPNWLGVVQHFAVLLAGEKIKDKKAFIELYEQVATRTIMYAFAQERTPEFETLVNSWAHQVYDAGPDCTLEDVKKIFDDHITYPASLVEQMKANALNWSYLKSAERRRIRAALSLMSWTLDEQSKESNGNIEEYFRVRRKKGERAGWDIDHVEPQRCEVLGLSEEEKNRFGNLVLLHPADNRGAKNATASTKVAAYEQSKIILTKSLVAGNFPNRMKSQIDLVRSKFGSSEDKFVTDWGSQGVEKRTNFYVKFLTSIITRAS